MVFMELEKTAGIMMRNVLNIFNKYIIYLLFMLNISNEKPVENQH